MNHEQFHELLCLRLYGEIGDDEGRALDGHLDGCAECRTFAAELQTTLAPLARTAQRSTQPELELSRPALAELSAHARRASRARRWIPWATFAAGLAAGVALALLSGAAAQQLEPGTAAVQSFARLDGAPPFVPRADPPPPASTRGLLARLGDLRH